MMPWLNLRTSRPHIVLLLTVVVSCGILGTVNYFTSKTTAAVRAYLQGESNYSKGQKDAARQLMLFILHEDVHYYERFKLEISIPQGDSIGRVNLLAEGSIDTVRAGFLQGKNHPNDVEKLIWLFQNFKNVSFMAEAIRIWSEADALVAQLNRMGEEMYQEYVHLSEHTDTPEDRQKRLAEQLAKIDVLTHALTVKEREFADHMGDTARYIGNMLFYVNLLFILLIVGSSTLLSALMLRSLQESKGQLALNNRELTEANTRLDHFVYASSHDLKAPINNMEGLVRLLEAKDRDETSADLLDKMKLCLGGLRLTIHDIENLMKTDRLGQGDAEEVNFEKVFAQILDENEVTLKYDDVHFYSSFECPSINYPRIAVKSIMQNLVSNAVKYRSPDRPAEIHVRTYLINNRPALSVADNGIGMDLEKHGHKLFGMFKRLHAHVPGSGLGLYAIKQVVEKNGGRIEVESKVNEGSTFVVRF